VNIIFHKCRGTCRCINPNVRQPESLRTHFVLAMVLNVVAFEPVDSLNIPIKFCPAVEVEAASRRNTISGCVLPITL
jgi:hypothetical protein